MRQGEQHYNEVRLCGGPGGLLGMLNLQQSNTHFRTKGHFSPWHCETTQAKLLRLNVVFFSPSTTGSVYFAALFTQCLLSQSFVTSDEMLKLRAALPQ